MSKGETRIREILDRAQCRYEMEKSFSDLKCGLFRFDFYVFDLFGAPTLIEVDGEQHFRYVKAFYRSRPDWEKAREHDRRKNSYCLAKEIPLYRIPYWELKNIYTLEDIVQEKFRVRDRWHNDKITAPAN